MLEGSNLAKAFLQNGTVRSLWQLKLSLLSFSVGDSEGTLVFYYFVFGKYGTRPLAHFALPKALWISLS